MDCLKLSMRFETTHSRRGSALPASSTDATRAGLMGSCPPPNLSEPVLPLSCTCDSWRAPCLERAARDIADGVTRGETKFEQLMVAGHEIAANIAQLVSAARVKAPSSSVHVVPLEDASRSG